MTPEKKQRPIIVDTHSKARSGQKPATTSSSDNSSCELIIDVENDDQSPIQPLSRGNPDSTNAKLKRISRRKRRKMSMPCDDEELFDAKFEETIRKSAAKNNLTPICVKKLLKKLVMNEHVFAIVRLKEEDEEKSRKRNVVKNLQENYEDDGDDEDDEEKEHPVLKLTRLKAKELNQTLFPLVPLNAPTADEDVAALIREELNSDDDDEEYKPGEDEIPSDEDPNTTISDIDSQPSTPITTVTVAANENDLESQYTPDGIFKIPKPRTDSYCSQSEQEQENIALRTRSKLCLSTTDIETLESTFIPPDITTDMYENDGDMDQAWKDFLEEFTRPLPKDLEDDDDNDPEYVAADMIPLDAEEMRAVKVSKKELNELVSELMEMSNIDEPYLEQALNETLNESLNCAQIDGRPNILDSSLPLSELQLSCTEMHPTMQTTFSGLSEKFSVLSSDQNVTGLTQITNYDSSTGSQNVSLSTNFPLTPSIPTRSIDMDYCSAHKNENYAEITHQALQALDVKLASIPATSMINQQNRFFIKYSIADGTMVSDESEEIYKPMPSEEKRYRFHTRELPVTVELSDAAVGFTNFQLYLLQQQLRMHVQLTSQHFLQTYAHPLLWEHAKTFKSMLKELEELGKVKPNMLPWNLPMALECCQSWEDELEIENESNILFMKYMDEEIAHGQAVRTRNRKYYQGEFHWRIREKIINCKAFMYASLIPHKAFRVDSNEVCSGARFCNSEEHMIAFWFELAFTRLQEQQNASAVGKRMKKPTISQVCDYVIKHIWPNFTRMQLLKLAYSRKKSVHHHSPITFLLTHGFAPPFKQVLEVVDFNKLIPFARYQKGILPSNWERYIYSSRTISNAEQKKQTSLWQLKAEHQQPRQSSSSVREASDATALQCRIRNVPSAGCSSNPKNQQIISREPINEKQYKSATDNVVANRNRKVVTNLSEVSECVVLANSTTGVNNEHPSNNSDLSKNVTVDCGRSCQSSKGSVEQVYVENQRNAELYRSALKVGCDNYGENANLAFMKINPVLSMPSLDTSVAQQNFNRPTANAKLYTVLKKHLQEFKEEHKQKAAAASVLKPSHPVWKVYSHFRQLEVYIRFLDGLRKMSENLVAYRHRYSALRQYTPQRLSGLLQLFHYQQPDGTLVISARYITHRFGDYCSMEDKDAMFAFNYYEKVEETLLASGRSDLLERFEEIMRNFNELQDSVSLLYYQLEDFLGESFPELMDMFLTFLLPGQAAEVGKFFEHFILTNMSDFLEKLNFFFAKQPSQLKKVHACLNELSNEPNVTMEQVKLKVLPLLKGSALLSEWFLQLFPCGRPPESTMCDYENVTMKKPLTDNFDSSLVYEQVPNVEAVTENQECTAPPNSIRYIQGRIFLGALPARLTFLANNCLTKTDPTQGGNSNLEQNLCDDVTLKAHAIRLNPLMHCPKGLTYADVAPLLTTDANGEASTSQTHEDILECVNTDDESSKAVISPKKLPPKLPIKKRFSSPTSRKLSNSPSDENSSSPTGKESVLLKKMASAPVSVSPDSKALSTCKKLKTLIESTQTAPQEENHQGVPHAIPSEILSEPTVESLPPVSTTDPITSNDQSLKLEPELSNEPSSEPEAPSWTRQEDEIILLKIIKGYSSVQSFVQQIEQQLPERTSDQIQSRVEFLNEMLRRVHQK